MKLLNFSEPVEFEDIIPGSHNRWGNDALLFRINKGMAKLSTKYGTAKSGETYGFLLLDNKPLINNYGQELYCPTCAKFLSIGLGRENVDSGVIYTIKISQEPSNDITFAFENVKPMLSILEDGYYLLTRIEMIPTDGDGNFFGIYPSLRSFIKQPRMYIISIMLARALPNSYFLLRVLIV